MTESAWPASEGGEEAFAEFLARREDGEALDIEAFCAERPEHAGELRRLWAMWVDMAPLLGEEDGRSGLSTLLRNFGPGIDPGVSLDPQGRRRSGDAGTRYEIRGEVGRGGMGQVLEVFDPDLRRHLAMKIIRSGPDGSRATETPRRISRFLEEAQITGQLGHPGIVPVHDLGVDARGRAYFTMPLVEGHTLEEIFALVERGEDGWTQTRVLGVLLKVCDAMAFAHSRGVIHRDLKPANVMVGRFGETYVMDWGLARVLEREDPRDLRLRTLREYVSDAEDARRIEDADGFDLVTMEGDVVGTPAYMSPEQAEGRHEDMGRAADVYAVGAILYHLLALRRPYDDGTKRTSREVLDRVLAGPPAPLGSHRAAPAPELVAICEKAMARRPEDRFADMSEMGEDLRAYLEGRVVRAYERGGWAEFKKWVGRNRGLAAALGVALLVALGGLGGIAYVQAVETAKVLGLSDFQLLTEYEEAAEELWPAVPDTVPAIEAWLRDARELAGRLPQHEARLAVLEDRAGDEAPGGEDFAQRWQFEKLQELVAGLREFVGDDPPGLLAGVEERLAFARRVEAATIDEPAEAWAAARAYVEEHPDRYGDLDLAPQLGLVPLGPDPRTGLLEFAHLQSGAVPVRGAGGELELGPEHGLVLVLLPGGTFSMGDAYEPLPPDATAAPPGFVSDLESPPHEVALAPFFLSKYEMTQAQWERFTGSNPSANVGSTEPSPLRPVENISWERTSAVARHLDLELPTEAQWEYAARAGTTARWWGAGLPREGPRRENFGGFGTLPVGSGSPNPYGLHDMLGNLYEWCRELFAPYRAATVLLPGTGERVVETGDVRVLRGAAFVDLEEDVRSSRRAWASPDDRNAVTGVRPARALRPPVRAGS